MVLLLTITYIQEMYLDMHKVDSTPYSVKLICLDQDSKIEPTSRAFWASELTVTTPRLHDFITLCTVTLPEWDGWLF